MKKITIKKIIGSFLIAAFATTVFTSCGINGHNHAELRAVNPDDTRIYGDKGQPARQTLNKYKDDEDGKQGEKVDKIRLKFYPK